MSVFVVRNIRAIISTSITIVDNYSNCATIRQYYLLHVAQSGFKLTLDHDNYVPIHPSANKFMSTFRSKIIFYI